MEVRKLIKLWRIPVDYKIRTPYEQATLHILKGFIDYAHKELEKKGYVVIMRETAHTPEWIVERIFVGKADLVKEYLDTRCR